ncbi:MAG: peptide-methionine (R)-S-oxide reductase MsrB [Bacteroidota bacterium]
MSLTKIKNVGMGFVFIVLTQLGACTSGNPSFSKHQNNNDSTSMSNYQVNKTEEEWKKELSPEQYRVLREKGTERPFSGKFEEHYEPGVYTCAACGNELFRSDTKFDAGCGWPSFYEALDKTKVIEKEDNTLGMRRVEILCARCGGHLGHVFDDGPKDKTGLRYCINSVSLDFKGKDSTKTK